MATYTVKTDGTGTYTTFKAALQAIAAGTVVGGDIIEIHTVETAAIFNVTNALTPSSAITIRPASGVSVSLPSFLDVTKSWDDATQGIRGFRKLTFERKNGTGRLKFGLHANFQACHDLIFDGGDSATDMRFATPDAPMFELTVVFFGAGSNVTIKDCEIKCRAGNAHGTAGAVYFDAGNYDTSAHWNGFTLDNTAIHDYGEDAVHLSWCDNVTISDNRFYDLWFPVPDEAHHTDGIHVTRGNNITIERNRFDHISYQGVIARYVHATDGGNLPLLGYIDNLTIRNNVFHHLGKSFTNGGTGGGDAITIMTNVRRCDVVNNSFDYLNRTTTSGSEGPSIQNRSVIWGWHAATQNSVLGDDINDMDLRVVNNAMTWARSHQGVTSGFTAINPTVWSNNVQSRDRTLTGITVAASNDTFTTSTAHGYTSGVTVTVTVIGSGAAGLTVGTYYVISSGLTSTTFKLSATLGGSAVNITSDGTGISVTSQQPKDVSDLAHGTPAAFADAASGDFTPLSTSALIGAGTGPVTATATAASDLVTTSTSHGWDVGQRVYLASIGSGAAGLTAATFYYVKTAPSATTATLSATAGGATIDITSDGTNLAFTPGVTVTTSDFAGGTRPFTGTVYDIGAEEYQGAVGGGGGAAIAGGTAAESIVDTGNKNMTLVVPVGATLAVLVLGLEHSASPPEPSSVTCGGQAMTKAITRVSSGGLNRISIYYLFNPPTGSVTVNVTQSPTAVQGAMIARAYTGGVNTAGTPLTNGSDGSGGEIVNTIDTTAAGANALIVGAASHGSSTATFAVDTTPTAGLQTKVEDIWNTSPGSNAIAYGDLLDSGAVGSKAFAWQLSTSPGGQLGAAVAFPVDLVSNQAPVSNAGADFTAIVNTVVELDGGGSFDADANPITYAWAQHPTTPGLAVTASLSSTTVASPTFTPTAAGTYTWRLTVSDGTATDTDDVTVTVNDPPASVASTGALMVAL